MSVRSGNLKNKSKKMNTILSDDTQNASKSTIPVFINILNQLTPLPQEEAKKLEAASTWQILRKGEKFIAAGQVPRKFAFVHSGLFRYFYLDSSGNEFTKGFFPEHTFISSYSAMVQQTPSYFSIEALEDAGIFVIDYDAWKLLLSGNPCWKDILI